MTGQICFVYTSHTCMRHYIHKCVNRCLSDLCKYRYLSNSTPTASLRCSPHHYMLINDLPGVLWSACVSLMYVIHARIYTHLPSPSPSYYPAYGSSLNCRTLSFIIVLDWWGVAIDFLAAYHCRLAHWWQMIICILSSELGYR